MIFKTVATFATLASLVAVAQADMLSISNPTMGTTWKVADTVFLQWKGNCASMGNPSAKSVDVNLMSGPSTALRFVAKLASIDCSGTNTRKEFTIPAEVVKESGSYSLQVQTEPQLSYSNIFAIETATGTSGGSAGPTTTVGAGGAVAPTGGATHPSAATALIPSRGTTATALGVAISAVFVAAQLL
ncbi:hypothetical protein BGX28_004346 [Mortierella sp. GBA30]|nr:hypothetical protein BGX28_004346 [Mortierella sp. GBA30]